MPVNAAAPVNARGGDAGTTSNARGTARATGRGTNSVASTISNNIARTARRNNVVTARSGASQNDTVVSNASPRSAIRSAANVSARGGATVSSPSTVARSATKANIARSATAQNARGGGSKTNVSTFSRAATARATAIFNDISKMGSGYATCRDAYATCMDQLCAKANDTYRRCFCSERFIEFRDTEYALDEAKNLLMKFEDNNLNAVDKTAAEVAAMYSASEGERAIKKDTSAAAKMLDEIGDLLSGKKKTATQSISQSLGVMDLDFSGDIGDIWGEGAGSGSVFGMGGGTDISTLEGQQLYTQANKQCVSLIADSCESDAVFSMARSSYSILITQDCNAYEKSLNSKRSAVEQTVRTAEKYLREARLEEYRSHNSDDVNACINNVRDAMQKDTACGSDYRRCLDPTGAYINQLTGEPIYSQRLFELTDLIRLQGGQAGMLTDVLSQNPTFDSFLEDRKMFANDALDSCRDISKTVWEEFKRTALIEIAQAQDEKIEEVKNSCVNTMKECYDKQSDALKSFDDTTAQVTGAVTAYATRTMCEDKVIACASLYGDTKGCAFDGNGKLTAGNNVTDDGRARCGLTALLAFVDTVDDVRIAEGCAGALESYTQELCTPTASGQEYPWNCRFLNGSLTETIAGESKIENFGDTNRLEHNIVRFALNNCSDPNKPAADRTYGALPETTRIQVVNAVRDVVDLVTEQLADTCNSLEGTWMSTYQIATETQKLGEENFNSQYPHLAAFYTTVYGGNTNQGASYGRCVSSTKKVLCLAQNSDSKNPVATFNEATQRCEFKPEWYISKCDELGGIYEDNMCYVHETTYM